MKRGIALINGEILTMDPLLPRAQALLTRGSSIAEVGDSRAILDLAGRDTEIVDLTGKSVIPGFIDCHTHFISWGIESTRLDLSGARSFEQASEMVRAALEKRPLVRPFIAVNWDQSEWTDPHIPTAEELDRVTGPHPVILRRICGHVAVANRAALRLLPQAVKGIDWRRGRLFEDASLNLNRFFPPSERETTEGVDAAMERAGKEGITSIQDIVSLRQFRTYEDLRRRGRLKLRVYACYKHAHLTDLVESGMDEFCSDDWLRPGGIKIYADGSLGSGTAALSRPYKNTSDCGQLNLTLEDMLAIMRKADRNGFQLLIHAIGDRAIAQVLKAYEELLIGENPRRHRIEHLELATRAQMERLRKMGLVASMQPNFLRWQGPGGMYEKILGTRRRRMANRIGDLLRIGAHVAFGSDCMPLSPIEGIKCACRHPEERQRISVEEAMRAYTLGSAYASFDEDVKGSLKSGKLADLVILSQNPCKAERLEGLSVEATIVGGRPVYVSPELRLGGS